VSYLATIARRADEATRLNVVYEKQLEYLKAKYWKVALELYLSNLQSETLQREAQSEGVMDHGSDNTDGNGRMAGCPRK
jgi:hypothetical protein